MEDSLSMPELTVTLNAIRETEERRNRFAAAIQGIDLDKDTDGGKGQKEWEDMKARVYSGGTATDSNDVTALQGVNAQQAGFGIGLGLEYTDLKGEGPTNPLG
jgi:hypothetical protein